MLGKTLATNKGTVQEERNKPRGEDKTHVWKRRLMVSERWRLGAASVNVRVKACQPERQDWLWNNIVNNRVFSRVVRSIHGSSELRGVEQSPHRPRTRVKSCELPLFYLLIAPEDTTGGAVTECDGSNRSVWMGCVPPHVWLQGYMQLFSFQLQLQPLLFYCSFMLHTLFTWF